VTAFQNARKSNGIDVLRRIKADQWTQNIPIVVLTASKRGRDIAKCWRLGAETYIVKWVDFQNFSEMTSNLSLAWTLVKGTRT
jgi:two-component system response regulator